MTMAATKHIFLNHVYMDIRLEAIATRLEAIASRWRYVIFHEDLPVSALHVA